MTQFLLTVAAGKRLIAKGVAARDDVKTAMAKGSLVIVAGTTNGYVAEEILSGLGQTEGFDKARFFRGVNFPPAEARTESGRLPDESGFLGDVVIVKGKWERGKTIFDVAEFLREGDMVLKGGNALDPVTRRAGVLIGHPQGGTALPAIQACVGRRVRLLVPIGLEKRVFRSLDEIAAELNAAEGKGLRFLPLPGETFTELQAIEALTGARAFLAASGGVRGAEGGLWICASGSLESETAAANLAASLGAERPF
jgi:hypothetical protein